jgi:hypothetical protein
VKVVVVYESLYGNTREIAEAVARGLRDRAEVTLVSVAQVESAQLEDADLLVVGGPTHVHGMTSSRSRKGALDDARKRDLPAPALEETGLREWLEQIDTATRRAGAVFDTRIGKPKLLTGSAARGIADRLRGHGYEVVGEESFIVEGTAGPLREGELERASEWGRGLAAARAAERAAGGAQQTG